MGSFEWAFRSTVALHSPADARITTVRLRSAGNESLAFERKSALKTGKKVGKKRQKRRKKKQDLRKKGGKTNKKEKNDTFFCVFL